MVGFGNFNFSFLQNSFVGKGSSLFPTSNTAFQNGFVQNNNNKSDTNIYKSDLFNPSTSILADITPTQQLNYLGQKFNVPFNNNLDKYQQDVAKAVIKAKAKEYGVPLNIAYGIAGNESGFKMWSDIQKNIPVQGKNKSGGVLRSTDWGVMQINDKAHPNVAEKAKYNMEVNIEYGLKFLAGRRNVAKGNLNLGFGDWDKTIASYNLGHSPSSANDFKIAQNYVSRVKSNSLKYV